MIDKKISIFMLNMKGFSKGKCKTQEIYDSEDSIDHVSYRIIRKDGSIRCVDDIGRKVHSENGIPVFYVSIIDITEETVLSVSNKAL